ncbi:hypothetical protein GCM10022241_09270 [Micrococcus endophyticus]
MLSLAGRPRPIRMTTPARRAFSFGKRRRVAPLGRGVHAHALVPGAQEGLVREVLIAPMGYFG